MAKAKQHVVKPVPAVEWIVPALVEVVATPKDAGKALVTASVVGAGICRTYPLIETNSYPILETLSGIRDGASALKFIEEWGFPLPAPISGELNCELSELIGLSRTLELIWKLCALKQSTSTDWVDCVDIFENKFDSQLVIAQLKSHLYAPDGDYKSPFRSGSIFGAVSLQFSEFQRTYQKKDFQKNKAQWCRYFVQDILRSLLTQGLGLQSLTVDWVLEPVTQEWKLETRFIPSSPWSLAILELQKQALGGVKIRRCANQTCKDPLNGMINKRLGAKTCSDLCRKLLSDMNKKQRGKK